MASTKQRDIAALLRARIHKGVYAPGARIPPHRELLREFAVSPVTLQRAIDRLTVQGFLHARGNAGTFVTVHPPDRACCALVVPAADIGTSNNRFWTALISAASTWNDTEGRYFSTFFIDADNADHRQLCDLVADHAVTGLLFASLPYTFMQSPLLSAAVPRVSIGVRPVDWHVTRFASSFIELQQDGLLETIFAGFSTAGRRRVAVISNQLVDFAASGIAVARKSGLETHTAWWLGLPIEQSATPTVRSVARLLCSARPHERPDCLLITNDNHVPEAIAGILDAGLRIPDDLLVMAHANFPDAVPAAVPCHRYGYDARTILATAWDEITRLRAGQPTRAVKVPLTFT